MLRHALLFVILSAVIALYAPTLTAPFHGDDFVAFTEFKTKSLWAYSREVLEFKDANFYWRPLGKIFHRALFEGFGLDPFVFRSAALAIFLLTLVCLYSFCLRQGLGLKVAALATALFGIFPNHVVSVAWVTNTSRLMAVLFILLGLLVLQSRNRNRVIVEVGAWLLFIAAAISDETAMALAPVPLLFLLLDAERRRDPVRIGFRILAYGAMVAVLLPLQFSHTIDDEPRLASYGLGPHVFDQLWALASQLALPLTPASPVDILLPKIPTLQWTAGAVAIVAGGALFLAGSNNSRLLLIWTGLALSPFTLWNLNYTSPRYVYMAAVPFAIIIAWLVVTLAEALVKAVRSIGPRDWSRYSARTAQAAMLLVLLVVGFFSSKTVLARNQTWNEETAKYGRLESSLEKELPSVPPGARIIIFYSPWPDFWASATAQSLYGDRSIRVMDIPPERVDDLMLPPLTSQDFILYFVSPKSGLVHPDIVGH